MSAIGSVPLWLTRGVAQVSEAIPSIAGLETPAAFIVVLMLFIGSVFGILKVVLKQQEKNTIALIDYYREEAERDRTHAKDNMQLMREMQAHADDRTQSALQQVLFAFTTISDTKNVNLVEEIGARFAEIAKKQADLYQTDIKEYAGQFEKSTTPLISIVTDLNGIKRDIGTIINALRGIDDSTEAARVLRSLKDDWQLFSTSMVQDIEFIKSAAEDFRVAQGVSNERQSTD